MTTTPETPSLETPMDRIEITNVGTISNLVIPIPEGGGIVVLLGANGVGKTTAITATDAMRSKDARKSLTATDMKPSGEILGMGVKIRIGKSNTIRGQAACFGFESSLDPSKLVDPGIKDVKAADERRLKTLVLLAGVKVSAGQWLEALSFAKSSIDIEGLVDEDPIATADRCRRRIHEVALSRQRLAKSKANEAAMIQKELADIDTEVEHDADKLQDELETATAELAKFEHRRDESVVKIQEIDNAEEAFQRLSSSLTEIAPIEEKIAELMSSLEESRELILSIDGQIKSLEENRQEIRANMDINQVQLEDATKAVEKAKTQQASIASYKAIIDTGRPPVFSHTEFETLQDAKLKARSRMEHGVRVRDAIARIESAKAVEAEAAALIKEETRYREIARSLDKVLEQGLIDAGFDKIKVDGGFLCVQTDRGMEPFSQLSHGERWRIALELAAKGLPPGSILPVCQEAYESLDPTNRTEINAIAKEVGLTIITAEATEGELRAEVLA